MKRCVVEDRGSGDLKVSGYRTSSAAPGSRKPLGFRVEPGSRKPSGFRTVTSVYERTLITTRRFIALPSRVLFGATGFASPKLITFIL